MWINSGYLLNLQKFNGEAVCFLRGRKWTSVYVVGRSKGKIDPRTLHEGREREQRYSSTLPLISALHEVGWSTPRPGHFTPGERPHTNWTGGWVGPRTGLNECGKSRLPPGFDPRTVLPVASRYTDWASPALAYSSIIMKVIRCQGLVSVRTWTSRRCWMWPNFQSDLLPPSLG